MVFQLGGRYGILLSKGIPLLPMLFALALYALFSPYISQRKSYKQGTAYHCLYHDLQLGWDSKYRISYRFILIYSDDCLALEESPGRIQWILYKLAFQDNLFLVQDYPTLFLCMSLYWTWSFVKQDILLLSLGSGGHPFWLWQGLCNSLQISLELVWNCPGKQGFLSRDGLVNSQQRSHIKRYHVYRFDLHVLLRHNTQAVSLSLTPRRYTHLWSKWEVGICNLERSFDFSSRSHLYVDLCAGNKYQ